jgi:hypothetical protein
MLFVPRSTSQANIFQGGHYMRPDLIRLLVDTRRKEPITHCDEGGNVEKYSTQDRVGLSMPLDLPKTDAFAVKKGMKHTEIKQNGYNGLVN